MRNPTLRRRSFLKLGLVSLMASSMAGPTFAQEAAPPPETGDITVSWFGGNARNDLFNQLVDAYEEKTGITVGRQYAPYGDYFLRLGTQAVAGQMPDVVNMTHRELRGLADRGWLVDLTQYVEDGTIDLSKFPESVVDAGRVGEGLYMISIGNSAPVVFYNEALFEEAGVEAPTGDWNWEEFEQVAASLVGKLPEGHYALSDVSKNHNMLEGFLRSRGKTLFDAEGRIAFAAEDLAAWLDMWGRLRDAGAVPDAATAAQDLGAPEPQRLFATGKSALFATNANQLHIWQRHQQEHDQDPINITYLPGGQEAGISGIVGAYFGIASNSQDPAQAADFINWWINDPEMVKIYKNEHGVLGNTDLQATIAPELGVPEQRTSELLQELVPNATPFPVYPTNGSDVAALLDSKIDNHAFGMSDAQTAAQEFFSEVASLAEVATE